MKLFARTAAAIAAVCLCCAGLSSAAASSGSQVAIDIDTKSGRKAISPYIYGINGDIMNNDVMAGSIRAGGNRYTGYNWENNASNAGEDKEHISDSYLIDRIPAQQQSVPGAVALDLSDVCAAKNNAYSLMTLQMGGYAAADMNGAVTADEKAPSDRWVKVEPAKGAEFSMEPDQSDGVVYMDEFVNYLVNTLGDATTERGIKGYSLDNEPSLWRSTHPRIHPEPCGCVELIDKSVALAKAVKAVDPNAEIFGPALFGYSAFNNFLAPEDWDDVRYNGDYEWFVDYYLDEMKKAEDEAGMRLLDVFDVHYYTEAKGPCGERSCTHFNDQGCVNARMDSPKSLWDENYQEDSWITDTGARFFPLIPKLKASIDKFYPGTKLAFTEYDFGATFDVTGAMAEAEALGVFAENEIYFASLFCMRAGYQTAAIDLFTNYDGNGSGFGNTLVSCTHDNDVLTSAYAAINDENEDAVTLVIMNKSITDTTTASIRINDGEEYGYVHLYGINDLDAQVFDMTDSNSAITLSGGTITYEMAPRTLSLLYISKEKPVGTAAQNNAESLGSAEKKEDDKSGSKAGVIAGAAAGAAAIAAVGVVTGRKKKKN
ncbi:MAG: glycoside hydrolase family 44 protein [Ruminococcus sp.]|nr:glycoside hydrolase family 44 protein [Ruminococcus sp.]